MRKTDSMATNISKSVPIIVKKRTRISVGKILDLPRVDEKIKKMAKPKRLPLRRNVGILCKMMTRNKGTSCKPTTTSKAVQTIAPGNKEFNLNQFNTTDLKMLQRCDEPAIDLEETLTTYVITYFQDEKEIIFEPKYSSKCASVAQRKQSGRVLKKTTTNRRRPTKMPIMAPLLSDLTKNVISNMCLKLELVVSVWNQWVTSVNTIHAKLFHQLPPNELSDALSLFIKEVLKPNKGEYPPDIIYYLCLGIEKYLFEKGRFDNIFFDDSYQKFINLFDEIAKKFSLLYNDSYYIVTRIEEEHLWESKQLGAYSPMVLLNTLMFFNTKYFNLSTIHDHMQVSFTQIVKDWNHHKDELRNGDTKPDKNFFLRYFPSEATNGCSKNRKKFYEQFQNKENELRCPVKLYDFYLSKCPETTKICNATYYLLPEKNPTPESPVWFTTISLPQDNVDKMFNRIKMVKEINVAFLVN